VQTFCGQGGSSDANVSIFGAKTSGVLKFMVYPHGQGRGDWVSAKGVNFSRFCADDVVYGRPLSHIMWSIKRSVITIKQVTSQKCSNISKRVKSIIDEHSLFKHAL